MRLLLRANAHRHVARGCLEVAASPDTPHRERWQWQIRLLAPDQDPSPSPRPGVRRTTQPLPNGTTVEVLADPATVASTVDVLGLDAASAVERTLDRIVVLIASGGPVLVEHRHLLADADAMVLAGDDPLCVRVQSLDGGAARAAVVCLRSTEGRALDWVP